jgi:hypothetical protein
MYSINQRTGDVKNLLEQNLVIANHACALGEQYINILSGALSPRQHAAGWFAV